MAKKTATSKKLAKKKSGMKSGLKKTAVKEKKKIEIDYSTAKISPNDKLGDRFISFTAEDKNSGNEITCIELRSEMDPSLLKELEAQEQE